ncbi:MAG TPA: tetratricopeptide repeat protein [Rhizomicrobium sp.]|nr:tetratricopeptide repeat protein [Rhizomicrobium sp.]
MTNAAAWRVAALATMNKAALAAALSGDQAGEWVGAAAELGLAEAQIRLGRMRLEGEGATRDPHGAFRAFADAAAQGHGDGHNMLGRCYENGWGTEIDYPLAAHHYRIAAEQGLDWAQYNLAHMLLSGTGIAQDRAEAFRWYNQAAAQGHVRAMSLVGRCHEEGWGTTKNLVAALDCYRRSAEGGYFRGAYNYATMLEQTGCAANARLWFDRAIATALEPTRSRMIALRKHDLPG